MNRLDHFPHPNDEALDCYVDVARVVAIAAVEQPEGDVDAALHLEGGAVVVLAMSPKEAHRVVTALRSRRTEVDAAEPVRAMIVTKIGRA